MKLKLTVILATIVVTMGLLLGTSAAQDAEVIFDPEIAGKAIGIRNLEYEGTLYNVEFTSTGTVAKMVYGDFPGQFDFNLATTAFDAIDAVNRELNKADATGVGAEGSAAVPFFWVGFESKQEVDPLMEVVFYQPSFYGEMSEGNKLWIILQDSANSALYNYGTGVWAKFTEVSEPPDTKVIFEGNNATGIQNLQVDGKLYNVEFFYDSAENIYGDPPIFDFQDDVEAARSAVIDALNSEPAVETVGPVEDRNYSFGFDLKGPYVEVTNDYYKLFFGPWTQSTQTSLTTSGSIITYADFTEVTAPPSDNVVQVFVTGPFRGDLGGLASADALCQAAADSPGTLTESLGFSWTAWLSTTEQEGVAGGNVNADTRIPDAEYRLLNGTVVAKSKADLTDGMLEAPINLNEYGAPIAGLVWTGTLSDGTSRGTNCSNWTDGTSPAGACVQGDISCGSVGNTSVTDLQWTELAPVGFGCGTAYYLYCFGGGE